jgi:sugar-specific transcriptional regulator TrmB
MNKEALYKLGLTKGEAEVYLALLKVGFSSIGKIVAESKVTKSKVYDILSRLGTKGLVSSSLKNGVQFYDAAPPNFLVELINKQEQELKKEKEALNELLPSLLAMQKEPSKKQRTEIFDGFRGLKNAFQIAENEFEAEEEFLVLGVGVKLTAQQLRFFIDYHGQRIKSKIKTRVIFTSNLKGVKEYHQKQDKHNQERFIDQPSAVPINIYKDIIIIPLLEGPKETTILIRNETLAKGLKQYFETLWKLAKA